MKIMTYSYKKEDIVNAMHGCYEQIQLLDRRVEGPVHTLPILFAFRTQ